MKIISIRFTRLPIAAIFAMLLAAAPALPYSRAAAEYEVEDGLIKLTNAAYEIAFSTENGSIVYILDHSTGQPVIEGNAGGNLWSASLDSGDPIHSSSYRDQFSYAWDEANNLLTLSYSGALEVTITINPSEDAVIRMQATLVNESGRVISDFDFPNNLKVAEADVEDALLPMLPGALIAPQFFEEGRTFINVYPGVMFADYLAVRSVKGKFALYSQRTDILQPTLIGYQHLNDSGYTALVHNYRTWISDGESWNAPGAVLTIGQDYPQTISSYRTDNGIDHFPSLTEKLGEAADTYFASPFYKLDLVVLGKTFNALQEAVVHQLNFPGMVHFVAYQLAGHDRNYPDFIPPDPKWGTTEDFAALVSLIKERGSLAVPYTNFSWWNMDSPTMANLPADVPLNSVISIKDTFGLPGFETHNSRSGFVMNLHNRFVQDKITEQHELLRDTVGADAILEDQWGARVTPFDFNPAGLETYDPSTSYFEGVLSHYEAHADSNLMTEVGVDALAEHGIGFTGTNYLWDMLGYRSATAGVTSYYPMAGMMLRDKVLLYQHNLAAETWTDNKDMLRWNLAMGYGLSIAFYDKVVSRLNMDNPWLNLLGVFHQNVLAEYADELVVSYDGLGANVWRTTFESYTVHSNWDAEQPYSIGRHTLPPGGVVTQANDGSVTAGVFTAYNDQPLSDGDHYLLEVRSEDHVQVFQPVGADTPLHLQILPGWDAARVTAYGYDGTAIGAVDASVTGDLVEFTYRRTLDGQEVGYYEISSE